MMHALFGRPLRVVNVGLAAFAEPISRSGGTALHLDWAPPGCGEPAAAEALARLSASEALTQGNAVAFAAYLAARPVLEGIGIAGDVIPGMGERRILHAGPPILFSAMCGPMRGAIIGAILYEGWAADAEAALALASGGEIAFVPCHHHDAVGPMAGVISPSMPVWIVRNATAGNRAFSNLNEGLGKVLRFGAYGPEVIARLNWMRTVLAPTLAKALSALGELELNPLIAQALHMGDEVHNRNAAASGLLLKHLVPALLGSGASPSDVAAAVACIAGNDHFFLNISMAAAKAMLDAAHGVAASGMVTAMCRNGVEFGIRVGATGARWFTAPAPRVAGLYFAGYGVADAAGDLGDSAITETAGLGGFAMAAAPAIVKFVGGTSADALANTLAMRHITLGCNNAFTLPALDFSGTPAGIDVTRVVDTRILPVINTGIAHREPGIGQIGAGVTHAPMGCFTSAAIALADLLCEDRKGEATDA
jgi:hypothetical protein